MKKYLILSVLILAGCEKPTNEWQTSSISLKDNKELSDCTYISVYTGDKHLHVIRCPNSSTSNSYIVGKMRETVNVTENKTQKLSCVSNTDNTFTCKPIEKD